MAPRTRAGTAPSGGASTSSPRARTPLPRQESEIPEPAAHLGMGPPAALPPPRPLHSYVYHGDKGIKVGDPPNYKGKTLSEFHSFTRALERKFRLNLSQFNTHEVRVIYAASLLEGTPATTWATKERELERSNAAMTWEEFKNFLLDQIEDHRNRAFTAAQRFNSLRQRDDENPSDYNARFEEYWEELSDDLNLLKTQLYLAKLTHKVRTTISQYQSPPTNRTELVNLASRIYLNNQHHEKKGNKTPSKQPTTGSKRRHDGSDWITTFVLTAESQVILPVIAGWKKIGPPGHAKFTDGTKCHRFGIIQTKCEATDSEGTSKGSSLLLHAVNIIDEDVILGLPWLRENNPLIDWVTQAWRYRLTDEEAAIEEPEEFHRKNLEDKIESIYCVAGDLDLEAGGEAATLTARLAVMSTTEGGRTQRLFTDYKDVFSEKEAAKFPDTKVRHKIHLEEGATAPYGPLYNLSVKELDVLRKYLEEAQSKNWIRPSKSPAGAPILFVPKKDGRLRLCVDYRGLNKVTVKDRYPLPLIDEMIDRLSGARVFSKIDIRDAYHRIRVNEDDIWKTAFRTKYGNFEYLVLPFGLCNAPATFQAYINEALRGLVDVSCIVYLDDILIFSKTEKEHDSHVREVLDRLRRHQLYANTEKCSFYTQEIDFLGYIVGVDGISMDRSRVSAIEDWPAPRTYREVQVFLGFANFYRRFIYAYSRIAAPLTDLLKGSVKGRKTGPFILTQDAVRAFEELKQAFADATMLNHFDPGLPSQCETDASGNGVCGIFSQLTPETFQRWKDRGLITSGDTGNGMPVGEGFFTELQGAVNGDQWPSSPRSYRSRKEVESFKIWRHYLQGCKYPVQVLTDHANLRYFLTTKSLTGRQARWAELLSEYDFFIRYRPGRLNPADAPSRRPDYDIVDGDEDPTKGPLPSLQKKLAAGGWGSLKLGNGAGKAAARPYTGGGELGSPQGTGTEGHELLVPRFAAIELAEDETVYNLPTQRLLEFIGELQQGDALTAARIQKLKEEGSGSNLEGASPERGGAAEEPSRWQLGECGLLLLNGSVFVPRSRAVRQELLRIHHDDPHAGHFGLEKTEELLRRKYVWDKLRTDVKEYVETCDVCQRIKVPRHKQYGELAPLPVPKGPWQDLSMDFIVDLPKSTRVKGYDSILVIVDRFTKMAKYIPTHKKVKAPELADLFLDAIIRDHGSPKSLVSDRGSLFTSKYWSAFCYHLTIRRLLSTAFHPQTDGQTERQNQTLEHHLRAFCSYHQNDWPRHLPTAEFAYNNAKNATLKVSPFYACYGYNPSLPSDVADDVLKGGIDSRNVERDRGTEYPSVPEVKARLELLDRIHGEAAKSIRRAQERQAEYYNRKHLPMKFSIGDQVLLSAKNIKTTRPCKKLSERWLGPFQIIRVVGKQAYELKLTSGFKSIHPVFHISYLEPYKQRPGAEPPRPDGVEIEGNTEYLVEGILDKRMHYNKVQYLVKWEGYPSSENSWEPLEHLENAEEEIAKYEVASRDRPAARQRCG
ncbi:hypothetical protein HCAG_03706 [Histoplasma mississippiense (nom. inval.)]|uniref:hypothetical protein n=1 Tax=Ajellomyces capsulatus (strain NAm1 / WU24) TaxID=2059318 RepID=UPI000157C1EE|nr:hypothetical protein HCAG_03706 [Histoplasma mississippiense (nom. inval.)]EDN07175.1 hypothetical protein HCAG_03706 [Histoplasma mississippiense (nom. inval.)]